MITELSASTPQRLSVIGGKACGLVRLMAAGLNVPEAWCLPADTAVEGELPSAVEAELKGFWETFRTQFPDSRLAVRSSAVAEDLDEASFAGIYQTRLDNDSASRLIESVRQCLQAVHAARARDYRAKQGKPVDLRIALVLQRMVNSDVSGVMLTANPRRPFAHEIVIDASWGLGEAVVSGIAHPDHIVLDRETGTIRETIIGSKEIEYRYVAGRGHTELEVGPARRQRLSLGPDQIRMMWELARQVTGKIGPRQDIEWAIENGHDGGRLYVLQQRPITGLPPERPREIWSRKFGDEYLADYMTPFGHTVLTRWISEDYLKDMARLSGNTELAELDPIRRYHGYAYMSGAYIARMLRGVPPRFRTRDPMGWFTPLWVEQARAEPFEPWRLAGMLRAPAKDPRSPIAANPQVMAEHCRNVERLVRPKLFQDYRLLSMPEWRRQFAEAYELGREHFRVIRWGMGYYNPALHAALQSALKSFAHDDDGELYRACISGLPGTKTVEINRDIWRLGMVAREDPALRSALLGGAACQVAREKFPEAPFWKEFDRFMVLHGHRSATREVAQPRWRETPDVVLGFVRAQLHGSGARDPAGAEQEAIRRRQQAEEIALRRADRGIGGFARRRALSWLLRQAQTYTQYRENQRYYLDYLLCHIRNLTLDLGRRFREQRILGDVFEVFFLEREEVWALIDNPAADPELEARIEERVNEYLLWKDRLPATYLFDEVETEGEIAEGDPAGALDRGAGQGLGASRGVARGRARVVRELAHVEQVEPGEILVASNTDPGWTSVFPLLSGLITETGGLLSHGALLAREYGIPAVTGVRGATGFIKTGDLLEIDGSQGTIRHLTSEGLPQE